MSSDSDDSESENLGLKRPTLIKELQNVLSEYPDDGQIVKEAIQNAEDARATVVKILTDKRRFQPDQGSSKRRKRRFVECFQGPAICVYNDAEFTDSDWDGIRMLHASVKEEDPLKVGRFGLGFKSVFHLTDRLVIFSGDYIMYMDPFKGEDRYCRRKRTRKLKGEELKSVLHCFGEFGATQRTVEQGHFNGTLFWFPLRQQASDLSHTVYTNQKVDELVRAFSTEAGSMLLFLKNIERVEVLSKDDDRGAKELFTVRIVDSCLESVRGERRKFLRGVQEAGGRLPDQAIESVMELTVQATDNVQQTRESHDWLVVNYHPGIEEPSPELAALCSDAKLALKPHVGVAIPLDDQPDFQSQIFCFLPLPLLPHSPTGLPVHVNGYFALSQNRRHLKWPTKDQMINRAHLEDPVRWNCLMVKELVPLAYILLLKRLKKLRWQNPQAFYSACPDNDNVNERWRPLVDPVYKMLAADNSFYTKAHGGDWIGLSNAILQSFVPDTNANVQSAVVKVYSETDQPLVALPQYIEDKLRKLDLLQGVQTVTPQRTSQLVPSCLHRLSDQEKLNIFLYLASHKDAPQLLRSQCLLPLSDGSFGKFGAAETYWCEERLMRLFPGLERRFCSCNAALPSGVRDKLWHLAQSGHLSLCVLRDDDAARVVNLMQESLQQQFGSRQPSLQPDDPWLKELWQFLSTKAPWKRDLRPLGHIKLLPCVTETAVTLFPLDGLYVCRAARGLRSLNSDLSSSLTKLLITVLPQLPEYITHSEVLGARVQYPTPEGVLAVLAKLNTDYTLRWYAINKFNESASCQEVESLVQFLADCAASLQGADDLLRELNLFSLRGSNTYTSVSAVSCIGPDCNLPVEPQRLSLLSCTGKSRIAARKLGALEMALTELVQHILKSYSLYSVPDMIRLMKFFLGRQDLMSNQPLLQSARQVRFLTTVTGQLRAADELYDCSCAILLELFHGEEDKFPQGEFSNPDMLKKLRKLGLHTEKSVEPADLLQAAITTEQFLKKGNVQAAEKKAEGLWKFLVNRHSVYSRDILRSISQRHCLPCLQPKSRPSHYPSSLPMKSEPRVVRPADLCRIKHIQLAGSVLPVVKSDVPAGLGECLLIDSKLNAEKVIKHLENVAKSYSSKERTKCLNLLSNVFMFLDKHRSSKVIQTLRQIDCVPVESEEEMFRPGKFWVSRGENDISLKPYRFQLLRDFDPVKNLFLQCGATECQDENLLQEVLQEIRDKYEVSSQTHAVFHKDLQLVKQILDILKTVSSVPRGTVLLPVEHTEANVLKFRPAGQCTIARGASTPWLVDDGDEEIYFVHHDIHSNTAKELGALDIRQRALTGVEGLDFGYGQKEDLTTRLHSLLKESYTDGFSVPKEIIQNADDAGAKKVYFLLDERENKDARSNLISDNMASLQGPAIWALNDATFTDADFENIVKLGAGTKKEDTSKVGRFGLGFNAVYNLTDVPSFISCHTMAIFDPHVRYLPKGAGLKLDFRRPVNRSLLARMPDQFAPFQGVFGCRLHNEENVFFDGTLFRFPLRTAEQAKESKIKQESYSKKKRREFLKMLLERAGSLLMFTQNVSEIRVYYLPSHCTDPEMLECLLTVSRSCQDKYLMPKQTALYDDTILQYCTKCWRKNNDIKILEEIAITVDVGREAVDVCGVKEVHVTTQWRLAWATGTGDSMKAAKIQIEKEFVPLATVAVPLCDGRIQALGDIPFGFYQSGHLFCFLPLPREMVKMELPVNINGTFDLTSSRRSFVMHTEDDLQGGQIDWNAVLFGDAVCRAYLQLLESLHQEAKSDENYSKYFNLWPDSSNASLDSSFYRRLVSDGNIVLPVSGQGRWVAFQEAQFLDPGFRWSECGQLAWDAVNQFWEDEDSGLVDLPQHLCQLIQSAGQRDAFSAHVITKTEFYEKFFFPNIGSDFWRPDDRDKLTVYALMQDDEMIHDLVCKHYCIPCENSSRLKRPCELIHPYGEASKLFLPAEGRFPQGSSHAMNTGSVSFCSYACLSRLEQHGMACNDLSAEVLIERAMSVEPLLAKDRRTALQRVSSLIDYLAGRKGLLKSRLETYSTSERKALSQIRWLPVLRRPGDWPFPWEGDKVLDLAAPQELYLDTLANLVACTQPVLDTNALGQSRYNKTILGSLGVQVFEDFRDCRLAGITVEQLFAVVKHTGHGTADSKEKVQQICLDLYTFLNRFLHENPNSSLGIDISDKLPQPNVVWVGDRFTAASQVAFSCAYDCRPFLFQLEQSFRRFKLLFEVLGVKETFSAKDAVSVLQKIHDAHADHALRKDEIILVSMVVQLLCTAMKSRDKDPVLEEMEIFLPDLEGRMLSTRNLCLNDCPWLEESETMRFLHESISPEAARALGVETMRGKDFDELMSPIPFGQHEKLTVRIQRLLEGYQFDSSLFKELLQNADDAGATEIRFIVDTRTLGTERVPAGWSHHLQGPALCVYNDKSFTSKDMEGIQNVGEGSKGEDMLKTGQYGVGFNAVYHITDVPSFWTLENDTQEVICVFDPNCCYVRSTNKLEPGVKLRDMERIRKQYPDMFASYLGNFIDMSRPGTVFRFPLRTQIMADTSELKQPPVSKEDIRKLLFEFQAEAKSCLLFLNSLQKVGIYSVTDDSGMDLEYEADKSMHQLRTGSQNEFRAKLADVSRHAENLNTSLADIPASEVVTRYTIRDTMSEEEWLTVNRVGFADCSTLTDRLMADWKGRRLRLLPRGGVAVKLTQRQKQPGNLSDCYCVFCILPLPSNSTTDSPLQCHVNGQFVLDHETRRNLWECTGDVKTEWNMAVIEQVIVPAFITAIQEVKLAWFHSDIDAENILARRLASYHALFPDLQDGMHVYWKSLIKGFYKKIGGCPVFPVTHGEQPVPEWVPVVNDNSFPGYFSNLSDFFKPETSHSVQLSQGVRFVPTCAAGPDKTPKDKADELQLLLKNLNMKVVDTPFRVYEAFKKSGVEQVCKLEPVTVIEFLHSASSGRSDGCNAGNLPLPVKESAFQTVQNVQKITEFISKDSEFLDKLDGLPLSLRQSECLFYFQNMCDDLKPIVSPYSELLPGSAQAFLHVSVHRKFLPVSEKTSLWLREFTIPLLAHMLPDTLQNAIFTAGKACLLDMKKLPRPTWICQLWKFIDSELIKQKTEDRDDVATRTVMEEELACLSDWNLIPVKKKSDQEEQALLFPVKHMHHVLYLSEDAKQANRKLWDILYELPLPFLDISTLPAGSVLMKLVASIGHPRALLRALTSCRQSLTASKNNAYEILVYFNTNLSVLQDSSKDHEELKRELKCLPLYPGLDDGLVSVPPTAPTLCLKNDIPANGLREWSQIRSDPVMLIRQKVPEELRDFLQFRKVPDEDFYADYLLPSIEALPRHSIVTHMTEIKRVWNSLTEKKRVKLTHRLQHTAFIQKDGCLLQAERFYTPFEPVFRAMCPESFPPGPYCNLEWRDFMEAAGIICEVTDDMFIDFASSLEQMGQHRISEDLEKQSDVLVAHLLGRGNLFEGRLLYQVLNIAFIRPSEWSGSSEGELLKKIAKPFSENRLVSFSQSCSEQHVHLVWSSSSLIHGSADLSSRVNLLNQNHRKAVLQKLAFLEGAPKGKVILHFTNICRSLAEPEGQRLFRSLPDQELKLLETVMDELYEFLNSLERWDVGSQLEELPVICDLRNRQMLKPENVILDLREEEAISGHIQKAPHEFGRYFQLFKKLGVAERVTANHYAKVLKWLKTEAAGETVHVEEKKIVKQATEGVFRCLRSKNEAERILSVSELYLPSQSEHLEVSSELTFKDDTLFGQRLQETSIDIKFFIGFYTLGIEVNFPLDEIRHLPECHQMKMLSDVVREVVTDQSKSTAYEGRHSVDFLDKVSDPDCTEAIVRLAYHQHRESYSQAPFTKETAEAIINGFSAIAVKESPDLQTVLLLNGRIVQGSECRKLSYADKVKSDPRSCTVYLDSKACLNMEENIDTFIHSFALAVKFMACPGLDNHLLHSVLRNPRKARRILDEYQIAVCDFKTATERSWLPEPGTFIRTEHHCYLDNNFYEFYSGEHVGYEVFDPDVDSLETDDDTPVYIYAKVVKEITEEGQENVPLLARRYRVNLGFERGEAVVSVTQLYKFVRKARQGNTKELAKYEGPADGDHDGSFPTDLAAVLRDIRRTLSEAWRIHDEGGRKRVMKRLYLKWHPDKNLGREEFCTKVMQAIQHYADLLDKGRALPDEDDMHFSRYSAGQSSAYYSFFQHMHRRGRAYRQDYDSDTSFGRRTWGAHRPSNPQPGEGRRWFLQAKADLAAARTAMENFTESYNWICYMCHQSVEKALKSVLYQRDSESYILQSHDLCSLAVEVGDTELTELASLLDSRLGYHTRMRYPDVVAYPLIPAEQFSDDDASFACDIAGQTIDRVQNVRP